MSRFLCALLLVLVAFPAAAQVSRIAAVVNDQVISVEDLAARLRLVMTSSNIPDTPENEQKLSHRVLRNLIDEKLEMQEAKRLNITVSEKEVNEAFARLETQNKMPKGGLDTFLKEHGIDRSTLVGQVTAALAWSKVVHQSLSQLAQISEEEVDTVMARLRETAGEPKSRIAEIFLAVDTPKQDEEVHGFADRLEDQLHQGASFPQLARQFSQSATAAVGGDLGWVVPSQLSPEIGAAVQHLEAGQISPPIRGAGGYYIVLVIEKQAAGSGVDDEKVSLTQVMFPLPENASPAEQQKVSAEAEEVSKQAKSCGELAQLGHEKAPQTSGDLGWVKIGELPAELRQTVHKLKVAEASPPVRLRGGIGVLMVCDRQASPSALPTREEVTNNLTEGKFETLAQRYLRDLRRQAFIDIRI
jgi:peptidyl-prolyl cis-trans isomerase SurA